MRSKQKCKFNLQIDSRPQARMPETLKFFDGMESA
jgi:hypothetical protein